MDIKLYKLKDLKIALETNSLWNDGNVPISKHKVISLFHNPRADDEDTVLITGIKENKIIGYLCILPDKIFIEGREQKFGWLSAWWVAPEDRNSRLGAILLINALKAWDNNIGNSDFTEQAKDVLDSINKFFTLKEINEFKYLIRFNSHELLTRKYPKLKSLKFILKAIDIIGNIFIDFKLSFVKRKMLKRNILSYEYISEIDKETHEFIKKFRKNELLARDIDELNLITRYPWVIHAPAEDKISKRYNFLSLAKSFYYLQIKIFNDKNDMIGYLLLRKRNSELTIPYCYYNDEYKTEILKVLILHICMLKVDMFITKNDELTPYLQNVKIPHIFLKKNKRYAYITTKYKNIDFSKYHFQDGDSDSAFT
jgi:hypothetical protein